MQPRTNLTKGDNFLINRYRRKEEVINVHGGVLDKSSSTTFLIKLGLWIAENHFELYEDFAKMYRGDGGDEDDDG